MAKPDKNRPSPLKDRSPRVRTHKPGFVRFPPLLGEGTGAGGGRGVGRRHKVFSRALTPNGTSRGEGTLETNRRQEWMPVRHTTLPSCSREVGNYHPLANQPASRRAHKPNLADPGLTFSARDWAGTRRAALSPALPGERGTGAARSQSHGGALGTERFRKLRCAALFWDWS